MAEGLLRHLAGDRYEALSAGSKPAGYVHRKAIQVLDELDIDLRAQRSKSIDEFLPPAGTPPDWIISVCSNAERECPHFPGPVDRKHWPFDDPADATGSEAEILATFRRVRDEIRARLERALAEGELEDA